MSLLLAPINLNEADRAAVQTVLDSQGWQLLQGVIAASIEKAQQDLADQEYTELDFKIKQREIRLLKEYYSFFNFAENIWETEDKAEELEQEDIE